jgi:hypothetical protein
MNFLAWATIAVVVVLTVVAYNAIPVEFREWVGGGVVIIGGVFILRSWWKRQKQVHKERGNANELEWLDELVKEHDDGIRDNREKIEWLIRTIEKEHEPSERLSEHLYSARLAIDPKLDPKRLQAELRARLGEEVAKMKDEILQKK